MRLIRFLIALLCIAAGVVVGALNPQPVSLDLGFTTLRGTLGVSMLIALLVGAIACGLVLAASVVVPLRQQLRRERARHAAASGQPQIGHSCQRLPHPLVLPLPSAPRPQKRRL